MSSITLTELYSLLSEKVGKETALSLTSYIERKIDKEVEQNRSDLVTKKELEKRSRWKLGIFIIVSLMIFGLFIAILLK
jgi:cytoskeletal protein RodZ